MDLLKVAAVFVVILILLNYKLPLFAGMLAGTALLLVFFGVGLPEFGSIAWNSVSSWGTWQVVLALYVIAVLQCSLDKRKHLETAQNAMNGLFKDQRLNAALASIFIGMMPAPPAVVICGRIMDNMAGDHLTREEKACIASYYRHIPEGVLPTFPMVIIICGLSGVPVASFVLTMLPMVAVLIVLGFLFYLRKIPKMDSDNQTDEGVSKAESLKRLARSLWTIFVSIVIIIAFDMQAWLAVTLVLAVNIFVDRFTLAELKAMLIKAFDWKITVGTFAVYIFKDVLISTGIISKMPDYFSKLPIPTFLALALLFFFGTLVGSANAVGTAFTPLAFSMMDGSVALLVLLMGFSYCASQVSPTHVCMAVVCEHFGISLSSFIRKMFPMVLCYATALVGYYLLLSLVL